MRVSFGRLVIRSLRFHWRGHLGVLLGAAVGSAALIGALVVGDSVRESLRETAMQRLPDVWAAMTAGDRFLRSSLLERIHSSSANRFPIPAPKDASGKLTWGTFAGPDSVGFGVIRLAA